jgi:predicted histone-like DNA-binding protein
MGIPFKRVERANPLDRSGAKLFYPVVMRANNTVTLEKMVDAMKDTSSLSKGDIQSVITNFVEATVKHLYDGHTVNIANFGVFTVAIRAQGAATRADCKESNITAVKIRFRPSNSIKPNLTATRGPQKVEFFDMERENNLYPQENEGGEGGNTGGGNDGDGGGDIGMG